MTQFPGKVHDWDQLGADGQQRLLDRPSQLTAQSTQSQAAEIVAQVRAGGDAVLRQLGARLDGVELEQLRVTPQELELACDSLSSASRQAIDQAIATVTRFHEAQRQPRLRVETAPGVICERWEVPIDAVGLYVPAGSAALPSTAIMLAAPARIANNPLRVLCTPPAADGSANAAVLYAAAACGVQQVFKLGGAQAIAAMAYGTESVPKVNKIFGPGNAWVTAAKQLIALDPAGAACDLPAGPSEVMIIADEHAQAEFIASDLLAQAEHGPDSQVLLVCNSLDLIQQVQQAIQQQLPQRGRLAVITQALEHARWILVSNLQTALEVANQHAPEHLIIASAEPRVLLEGVRNAGSVFLGPWSPEAIGDYCSGTNHVLPTYGHARACSGLSLADFMRRFTVQELTPAGLAQLGPVATELARLERLDAHAASVTIRLEHLAVRAP